MCVYGHAPRDEGRQTPSARGSIIIQIPLIIAQSKDHPCSEGGDSACPPGPPSADYDGAVITFPRVLSLFRRARWWGLNPYEPAGFLNISPRAVIMELSHDPSYPRCTRGIVMTAGFCSEIPVPGICLVTDRGITCSYSEVDLAALFFNTCFIALMLSI
jgi:hypothetical protein